MGDLKDKIQQHTEKLESVIDDSRKKATDKAAKLREDAKVTLAESEQELNKMADSIETIGHKGVEAVKSAIEEQKK